MATGALYIAGFLNSVLFTTPVTAYLDLYGHSMNL